MSSPNPDIEKVDVTVYEDLERFFRRRIPDLGAEGFREEVGKKMIDAKRPRRGRPRK